MKVKLKELVKRIFGHNHETAARRAYDESFGQRNFENVVMYCMDASGFCTIYTPNVLRQSDIKLKQLRERSSLWMSTKCTLN